MTPSAGMHEQLMHAKLLCSLQCDSSRGIQRHASSANTSAFADLEWVPNGLQCPFEVVFILAADVLGVLTFFALLVLLLYPLALCMQAARNAEPPDMAKAIRKKEAARDAKRNKLEKAMKQDAAASKTGETAPAGSIDDRKAKIQVCSIALLLPAADT